jgi:Fungal N-terminal domain of STAND proteins
MDPLSCAASVIALIQISDGILSLCREYALGVRDAREDIRRLDNEVRALCDVMKRVDKMTQSSDATRLQASKSLADTMMVCLSDLNSIKSRLDPGRGRKVINRVGLRALKWPFKSKDVVKIIEALDRHKGTISLALHVDQRQGFKRYFQQVY